MNSCQGICVSVGCIKKCVRPSVTNGLFELSTHSPIVSNVMFPVPEHYGHKKIMLKVTEFKNKRKSFAVLNRVYIHIFKI